VKPGERLSRIHIFGASGSGTTTLARAVAARLQCPALDTDDFYWLPTERPFQEKRPAARRLELLQDELSRTAGWVLAGSLCGWGDALIPLFDLVVLLEVDPAVRLQRLREREATRYGASRIAAGGDLYTSHEAFLEWAAQYDTGETDVRSWRLHEAWLQLLPSRIRVLRLDSGRPLDDLVAVVLQAAAV
jgi:adenylate kinase family enzyme